MINVKLLAHLFPAVCSNFSVFVVLRKLILQGLVLLAIFHEHGCIISSLEAAILKKDFSNCTVGAEIHFGPVSGRLWVVLGCPDRTQIYWKRPRDDTGRRSFAVVSV